MSVARYEVWCDDEFWYVGHRRHGDVPIARFSGASAQENARRFSRDDHARKLVLGLIGALDTVEELRSELRLVLSEAP